MDRTLLREVAKRWGVRQLSRRAALGAFSGSAAALLGVGWRRKATAATPLMGQSGFVGDWRVTFVIGGRPAAGSLTTFTSDGIISTNQPALTTPSAPDGVMLQSTGLGTWFEWLPGRRFLIQRWEVPVPEAPDGIAIIGADPEREGGYLQHYFDARGVARVYKMSFDDGVWTLWRDEPDFSPLDFAQRFTGTLGDDGTTIVGRWEINHDGTAWEHDFDLTYTRA